MKSIFKALSILASAACMIACTEKEGPVENPEEDQKQEEEAQKPTQMFKITAISFNIKFPDSKDTNEKAWENRKVGVIEMLKKKNPDLSVFRSATSARDLTSSRTFHSMTATDL